MGLVEVRYGDELVTIAKSTGAVRTALDRELQRVAELEAAAADMLATQHRRRTAFTQALTDLNTLLEPSQ